MVELASGLGLANSQKLLLESRLPVPYSVGVASILRYFAARKNQFVGE
jgi:hypothetical protein